MRMSKKLFSAGTISIFAAFLTGGCVTNKITDPARTATEQLLLSTATDRALQSPDFMIFANRKVFLDATYFDSYDSKYVLGTVRDALSRAGALLQGSAASSDIIIETRSGALSIDSSDTLFGIPNMAVPVPFAGVLTIPELAFYKSDTQDSTAKIALLAFAKESGAHVYSSGPLDGKSYDQHYRLLFISWIRTDIPEKQKNKKEAWQYQGWFPQYDPANLPSTNAPSANLHPANPSSTNTPAADFPPAQTTTNAAGM